MSTHDDTRRSVAAWLEAEAVDRAPSRLIEASRDRVRATPQRAGWWPTPTVSIRNTFATLAVAAAAVVVAAFGVVGLMQPSGPTIGPAGIFASPTPQPSVAVSSARPTATGTVPPTTPPAASPTPAPPTSSRMWPQSTEEEVRLAQERAEAGEPDHPWQIDPSLYSADVDLTSPEIIDRFLRDVLGWDEFLYDVHASNGDLSIGPRRMDLVYLRCAPGETNPLYPIADRNAPGVERCAPTIDGLRYESVRLNLDQPEGKGPTGLWVVGEWSTAPYAPVDPRVAETEVTARLEEFLAARMAGEGAEGKVEVYGGRCGGRMRAACRIDEVPLLYATTAGAPYERFEIERVAGPRWPDAEMEFKVQLFADDGATAVEESYSWKEAEVYGQAHAGLALVNDVLETTENGRPVAAPFAFFDGEVSGWADRPWEVSHQYFNYGLSLNGLYGDERISFVLAPLPVDAGCRSGPAPADAAALAQAIRSDSDYEATVPVDVIVGGAKGLQLDVMLAPGARVCPDTDGRSTVVTSAVPTRYAGGGWGAAIGQDGRMRLYLIDLPEGSSERTLAIAVSAPTPRFESVVEAATPVVDSIEFHTP